MSWLDSIRYRLRVLARPADHDREAAEETEFHVELEAMQRMHAATGHLSNDAARDAARRRFGNATYYREERRRIAGITVFEALVQDLRFAARTLRRAPTFTIVAVLTLAIGIGANTAIFSAVDALLLRPLPFREPDRLMSLSLTIPGPAQRPELQDVAWSYPKFMAFRGAQTVFTTTTLWATSQFTLRVSDEGMRVTGDYVDSRFLTTIGIPPAIGRDFQAEEDQPGAHVTIISDDLWQTMFNADPNVIGKRVDVDDGPPYTVIGVMPPKFHGVSGESYFWMPVASAPGAWGAADANRHSFFAIGRLAPGETIDHAKVVVREIGARIDATFPDPRTASRHWSAAAKELDAVRVGSDTRRMLFILLGAVGVVLLIACVNVANLFLVRASARRREIAVRLAVGAGRGRLVRQLLVESLLLASLGGVASVAFAYVGIKVLASLQLAFALGAEQNAGIGTGYFGEMKIDLAALAFAGALAMATGLLFGLVPALQATRPSLTETLKDDGAVRSSRRRRLSGRNLLTVIEIALAVVLLAGSGLLIRSLGMLMGVRPGFDADHVLSMRINRSPAWAKDSLSLFYDRAIAELSAIPGVTGVALGDMPPAGGGGAGVDVVLRDRAAPREPLHSGVHYITPEWPGVLHVPLLRGRLFTRGDLPTTRKVVLVNETAAREFWPDQDPIGRPITIVEGTFAHDTAYVAGVLGDVRYGGMSQLPHPDVYVSYYQMPFSWRMMLFVRTQNDPVSLINAARQTLRRAAPGFPVYDVNTMEQRVRAITATPRFSALLLSLFATLALVLAMIGTYGVISFSVAQRRREIGVRVALGATRLDVTRLIVGQGMALATVGATAGIVAALLATRLLKSMLFGVETTDPTTLVGIISVLTLAVLAASWIPARRAAGVPAVQALRGD